MIDSVSGFPILKAPSWTDGIDSKNTWVLGRSGVTAGRCIAWNEEHLHNFADCKCLIVDLTTLDPDTLDKLPPHIRTDLPPRIRERFDHGLVIICILPPIRDNPDQLNDMLFWSPEKFSVELTEPARTRTSQDFRLEEYIKKLGCWTMILKPDDGARIFGSVLTSNDDMIATELTPTYYGIDSSGRLVILPPLDDPDESIRVVLNILYEDEVTPDSIPDWVKDVEFPELDQIRNQIKTVKLEYEKTQQELKNKKGSFEKWNGLLFLNGKRLEHIVKDALIELGLSNVVPGNGDNEDLRFDLVIDKYKVATVEIKGKENGIKKDDLRQAMEWAFASGSKHTKPILVSNTFRLDVYPGSRNKRMNFNEFLDECECHNICIISTIMLYDLVRKKISGMDVDTDILISLIASSKGMINDWESAILPRSSQKNT